MAGLWIAQVDVCRDFCIEGRPISPKQASKAREQMREGHKISQISYRTDAASLAAMSAAFLVDIGSKIENGGGEITVRSSGLKGEFDLPTSGLADEEDSTRSQPIRIGSVVCIVSEDVSGTVVGMADSAFQVVVHRNEERTVPPSDLRFLSHSSSRHDPAGILCCPVYKRNRQLQTLWRRGLAYLKASFQSVTTISPYDWLESNVDLADAEEAWDPKNPAMWRMIDCLFHYFVRVTTQFRSGLSSQHIEAVNDACSDLRDAFLFGPYGKTDLDIDHAGIIAMIWGCAILEVQACDDIVGVLLVYLESNFGRVDRFLPILNRLIEKQNAESRHMWALLKLRSMVQQAMGDCKRRNKDLLAAIESGAPSDAHLFMMAGYVRRAHWTQAAHHALLFLGRSHIDAIENSEACFCLAYAMTKDACHDLQAASRVLLKNMLEFKQILQSPCNRELQRVATDFIAAADLTTDALQLFAQKGCSQHQCGCRFYRCGIVWKHHCRFLYGYEGSSYVESMAEMHYAVMDIAQRQTLALQTELQQDGLRCKALTPSIRQCNADMGQRLSHATCHKCGTRSMTSTCKKFKRCGGCMAVLYCSADCQKADWAIHKADCKLISQRTSLSEPTKRA